MTKPLSERLAVVKKFDRLRDGVIASHIFPQWSARPEQATVRDWEWFVNGANWQSERTATVDKCVVELVKAADAIEQEIGHLGSACLATLQSLTDARIALELAVAGLEGEKK